MTPHLEISGRRVGPGEPAWIVAEMSANHGGNFERAMRILDAAHKAGADAVKIQTYTADTLTLDSDAPPFRIEGTPWEGRRLHDLYREAAMPWEWHTRLFEAAAQIGIPLFSSPFDETAIDLLEQIGAPAYKIASFEMIDTGLLRRAARTGRPVIVSTGMATSAEIDEAVATLRGAGTSEIALLRCTSAYPAPPEEAHLRAIPALADRHGVVTGLSDHTLEDAVALAAVALGASIVEKHFTLARSDAGPDAEFSLEPDELHRLVRGIRMVEASLGVTDPGPTPRENVCRKLRRSLFVVQDIRAGDVFTRENLRSIRPADGMPPRYLDEVLGHRAARDIPSGTPLSWDLVK